MDAVIRFCFDIDPEELEPDTYAKIYGQAKWILDYTSLMQLQSASKLAKNG